jgi:hypothetical protein
MKVPSRSRVKKAASADNNSRHLQGGHGTQVCFPCQDHRIIFHTMATPFEKREWTFLITEKA